MRWRGWGLVLAVLGTLSGLAVTGRLLAIPQHRQSLTQPPSSAPIQLVSRATLPLLAIPEALRRPLRLPNLRQDGSCPTTPVVGPPMTPARPVAAVAVGHGPVHPVLFRAATAGRLERSSVLYWEAPKPLGGVAIVRGHRLSAPSDRIRFQDEQHKLRLVHVLDPAAAHPAGREGLWWHATPLRAGAGCYGFQIDGPRFSQALVVAFA